MFTVDGVALREHIKNISGIIDTLIKEKLMDKLDSIKFDTITLKMNRSVL